MEYKIKIEKKEITLSRLKLRGWTGLETVKKEIDAAASKNDFNQSFMYMVKFIEAALLSSVDIDWSALPWYDFLFIYNKVIELNSPTIEFPIIARSGTADEKKNPWEYDGRAWYYWLNLFAENYGWNSETIAEMDIDEAFGLLQEISINEQLEREWEWGLSEMAYEYDKTTKKSKYHPLPRPSWMQPIIPKQLPIIKIPKALMPVGNIVNLQEPKNGS